MANRTYTDLLAAIQGIAGVDSFTTTEQTNILSFVNTRLRQAYDACPVWPRYWVAAQARPATDGVIATTYDEAAGVVSVSSATRSGTTVTAVCAADVTFVTGMSVTVASLSGTVDPNGTYTVASFDGDTFTYELDSGTGSETYSGSGTVSPVAIPEIEEFIRVYAGNPNVLNSVREYEFFTDVDGCHIIGSNDGLNGFYVQFKKAWPGPYQNTATDIPAEFFDFVTRAAYSDFLAMDAQNDKSAAESIRAEQYLASRIMKAENMANSRRYTRYSTHLSRQNRW